MPYLKFGFDTSFLPRKHFVILTWSPQPLSHRPSFHYSHAHSRIISQLTSSASSRHLKQIPVSIILILLIAPSLHNSPDLPWLLFRPYYLSTCLPLSKLQPPPTPIHLTPSTPHSSSVASVKLTSLVSYLFFRTYTQHTHRTHRTHRSSCSFLNTLIPTLQIRTHQVITSSLSFG